MEILEYLQKYNLYKQDMKIITANCKKEEYDAISDQWKGLLNASTEAKLDIIIALWQAAVKDEMSLTIEYIREHFEDVLIVRIGATYNLIYLIKSKKGKTLYYIGSCPVEPSDIPDDMPASIKSFYTKLHNGFYDYCFKAMGLTEYKEVCSMPVWLEDLDPEDAEKYGVNSPSSANSYVFFENGMGDCAAYNIISNEGVLFYSGEGLEYGKNFWNVVDTWISIGLEG